MIKFNLYQDIKIFYNDTYEILLQKEAFNMILLGNIITGYKGIETTGWRNTKNWFMATVTENYQIKMIALMTPPHNLTLFATDASILFINCLIEGIINSSISISGVMGDDLLVTNFAKAYKNKLGLMYEISTKLGIYELTKVNCNNKIIGTIRHAKEGDIAFLPYWIESFNAECHHSLINNVNNDIEVYRHFNGLYVLEDNEIPVSIARITRKMQTCCGVNMVYTPPYFRNQGYATSCVALVSKIILDQGFEKCILYTDLDYSISNKIYKRIGYILIGNSLEIKFIEIKK